MEPPLTSDAVVVASSDPRLAWRAVESFAVVGAVTLTHPGEMAMRHGDRVAPDRHALWRRLNRLDSVTDYLLFFAVGTHTAGLGFAWIDGPLRSLVSAAVFTGLFLFLHAARARKPK